MVVEGGVVDCTGGKLVDEIVVVRSVCAGAIVEDDETLTEDEADKTMPGDDAPTTSSPEPHEEPTHATNAITRLPRHSDENRPRRLIQHPIGRPNVDLKVLTIPSDQMNGKFFPLADGRIRRIDPGQ
jgi:hypothetical protein